jgi:hypothetical protein
LEWGHRERSNEAGNIRFLNTAESLLLIAEYIYIAVMHSKTREITLECFWYTVPGWWQYFADEVQFFGACY